jgi:hypothetical protein
MFSRLNYFLVALGTVGLFLVAGQRALADSAAYVDMGLTSAPNNSQANAVSITFNGQVMNAAPGPYFFSVTSTGNLPAGVGPITSPLSAFCIDLSAGLTGNSTQYNLTSLNNAPTISKNNSSNVNGVVNAIELLYDTKYNTGINPAIGGWTTIAGATAGAYVNEAAFQLALWELTYDGAADIANYKSNPNYQFFGNGSFEASGSQAALAQSWLDSVLAAAEAGAQGSATVLPGLTLEALVSQCGYQDQLALIPTPKVQTVPAPPGLVLAGFGMVALIGRARLRRNAPAAA